MPRLGSPVHGSGWLLARLLRPLDGLEATDPVQIWPDLAELGQIRSINFEKSSLTRVARHSW
uniref:Uncharacterized protein n=1 Tax=Kalanchoe fedtschenkoi TaxID=63787 RepID=A0A7N0T0W6_KALFE